MGGRDEAGGSGPRGSNLIVPGPAGPRPRTPAWGGRERRALKGQARRRTDEAPCAPPVLLRNVTKVTAHPQGFPLEDSAAPGLQCGGEKQDFSAAEHVGF